MMNFLLKNYWLDYIYLVEFFYKICSSIQNHSTCHRWKTFYSRGQWPIHESIANEATHEMGGYHDWSLWRTCLSRMTCTWWSMFKQVLFGSSSFFGKLFALQSWRKEHLLSWLWHLMPQFLLKCVCVCEFEMVRHGVSPKQKPASVLLRRPTIGRAQCRRKKVEIDLAFLHVQRSCGCLKIKSATENKKHDVDYSSARVFGRFFWTEYVWTFWTSAGSSEILTLQDYRSFRGGWVVPKSPKKYAESGCCRVMFDGWPIRGSWFGDMPRRFFRFYHVSPCLAKIRQGNRAAAWSRTEKNNKNQVIFWWS